MWPHSPRIILDIPHTSTFSNESLLAFSADNPNLAAGLVMGIEERRRTLEAITQGDEDLERLIGNEFIAVALKIAAVRRREFSTGAF